MVVYFVVFYTKFQSLLQFLPNYLIPYDVQLQIHVFFLILFFSFFTGQFREIQGLIKVKVVSLQLTKPSNSNNGFIFMLQFFVHSANT